MGKIKAIYDIITGKAEQRSAQAASTETPKPRSGGSLGMLYAGTSAWNVSAVYACMRLLCDSVANLDINYKKKNDAGLYVDITDERLWHLLNISANERTSAYDFKQRLVSDLLIWGDAYVVPSYAETDYKELALVRPWCVSYDNDTRLYTISDDSEGVHGVYDESHVIHIKDLGPEANKGRGIVSLALRSIEIARAGEEETLNRINNGGDIRGVLGGSQQVRGIGKYQDQQLEFAAVDLDEKFRNGQRIVHLPGAVDFKQFSMSSADMQFLEMRKLSTQDICQFFGLNPALVTGEGQSAYKSASETVNMFMLTRLNPLLKKIENELTRKLIPEKYQPWRKIEFDRSGIYGCDPEGRLRYMKGLQELGIASINDLRAKENKAPIEGGDTAMVSANLKSVAELTNENKPAEPIGETDKNDETSKTRRRNKR